MSATSTIPALPAEAALELADYKIGSFTSDLADILNAVRAFAGGSVSIEEYLERKLRPAPREEPVDRDAVARIVVFASALVADVERIGRDAAELLETATNLHYDSCDRASADWHYDLAADWHRAEFERRSS